VAIDVFAADEQSAVPVDTFRWVQLAQRVLQNERLPSDVELSMLFVDHQAMADLNQRFLGNEGPTDVLAFPLDGDDIIERGRSPDSGGAGPGANHIERVEAPLLLGDVVICPEVAQRNAPAHAGTFDDEMALLVVHGILHLLGMDHAEEEEAAAMRRRERDLLERFHRHR
jgi:probable rRNA maturation factor